MKLKIGRILIIGFFGLGFLNSCAPKQGQPNEAPRPNIVLILADDLGYGDLACYGATQIKTPNCDRLASEGMLFTDAHSSSAVCAPTRYSLLSGTYDFRKTGRKWFAHDAPLAFDSTEVTLASMLKEMGYATACIGKWHIGFGRNSAEAKTLNPGPNEVGFDYFFGMFANHGEKYSEYIENHERVNDIHTGDTLKSQFRSIKTTDMLLGKALDFISANADKPFFLYYPTQTIHEPIIPETVFRTSEAGIYGDFVQEFDWTVGQVLEKIKSLGLEENTIFIVTSDNGGLMETDYEGIFRNYVVDGHKMNGDLRGQKADIYEGGHRVPFFIRWPGKIPAGTRNKQMVCLTDVVSTIASITGATLPPNQAIDSYDFSAMLTDTTATTPRNELVMNSGRGMKAVRKGNMKLVFGNGSGGLTKPYFVDSLAAGAAGQLFDLAADPGEKTNIYNQNPDIVLQLTKLFEDIKNKRTR